MQLDLDNQTYPSHKALIEELVGLSYTRVPMVMAPGEFSVRGAIIDVYSANHSHPLRIEYFGPKIDRMAAFDVHTQRSLSTVTTTSIFAADTTNKAFYFSCTDEELNDSLISVFQEDQYVVHETYGVGIFKGLYRLETRGIEGEFVLLHYRGADKVYVPLDQLSLLHPHTNRSDNPPEVHSLHDSKWKRSVSRVKKELVLVAEDLISLHQQRQAATGHAFAEDGVWQVDLENNFEHTETPDQRRASEEIKRDMEGPKPMDRLLCGDVGFGKTEVFIRAAFKAVEGEKQVAILVPTTVLAEQHFQTLTKRLKAFPVVIESLSRYKSKTAQSQVVEKLSNGKIDIVIGTQRLLQKDIRFKDLGLLIVDEEQRFGVTHKEKIKALKPMLDVLSVTATPIPRTLYMALTGARQMSEIRVPPTHRKPILTLVSDYDEALLKKAVKREIDRGGQVYYVFNNVAQIQQKRLYLSKILPGIRIAVAHGQMPQGKLQEEIAALVSGDTQVLLCSTIIENGMDVPNVNTVIIDNAHRFGLSQIHQLRGRVGRSDRQAYALLFHPMLDLLPDKAKRRLQAIKEYAALGSGYKLAKKDLEIRGAGALLGHKQHGYVSEIGFELYCKILSEQMRVRKGQSPAEQVSEGRCYVIPEAYIPSSRERLMIYQRMLQLRKPTEWESLVEELEDRYGPLPIALLEKLAVLV